MSSTLGLDDPSRAPLNTAYQLDVGRVVSQTISITVNNLPSFGLVGFICYLPVLFVQAILAVAPPPEDVAIWLTLAVSLAQGLAALVLTGALTFGVMRHLAGDKASAGEIVQAGLSCLGRVFVVSLMVGIMTTIGLVLCIVPGIFVMCMNWVAIPVAVMEQPGATASMTRSQELTTGTRLSVFAVILVIGMIYGVVSVVGSAAVVGVSGATASAGVRGAAALALTLVLIPFECLKAASAAVGYHELRRNREGVGLDELVRVFE
jgi:hypothetical protein